METKLSQPDWWIYFSPPGIVVPTHLYKIVFAREGYDVHTNANISLSQAILGGIIRIQVINGIWLRERDF